MPERFEIYVVDKWCHINTPPFRSFFQRHVSRLLTGTELCCLGTEHKDVNSLFRADTGCRTHDFLISSTTPHRDRLTSNKVFTESPHSRSRQPLQHKELDRHSKHRLLLHIYSFKFGSTLIRPCLISPQCAVNGFLNLTFTFSQKRNFFHPSDLEN